MINRTFIGRAFFGILHSIYILSALYHYALYVWRCSTIHPPLNGAPPYYKDSFLRLPVNEAKKSTAKLRMKRPCQCSCSHTASCL